MIFHDDDMFEDELRLYEQYSRGHLRQACSTALGLVAGVVIVRPATSTAGSSRQQLHEWPLVAERGRRSTRCRIYGDMKLTMQLPAHDTRSAAKAPRDATDIEDGRYPCQQQPAFKRVRTTHGRPHGYRDARFNFGSHRSTALHPRTLAHAA